MKSCWTWVIAAMMLSGCQTQENGVITEAPVAPKAIEQLTEAEPVVVPQVNKKRERIEAFIEKNADSFVVYAMRNVEPQELNTKIRELVEQPKASKGLKSADYGDLTLPALTHAEQIKRVYEARGYAPIFMQGGRLSDRTSIVVETFKNLDERGVTPKMLNPTAFLAAVDALGDDNQPTTSGPFTFNADERAILADAIETRGIDITNSAEIKRLIDECISNEDSLIPRLRSAVNDQMKGSVDDVKWAALADVLLADHVMNYARIVKFNNKTHLTDAEKSTLSKTPSKKEYEAIAIARMMNWFATVENESSKEAFEAQWNGLYPHHDQYERLIEAYRRYKSLPDWTTVKTGTLTPKKASPAVPLLKIRLAEEGYYKGDVSEEAQKSEAFSVYDNDIRAAVRLYHTTHQIDYDDDKSINKSFWTSLNTTREERIIQIQENIRRWYGSYLVPSDYFIYVNVPDFHGEVWKDGKMIHRFPVVAGSARRSCDPQTKQWYYINATPLMHARMAYLEYNPYWVVPNRIEQEDYIEKINADPTWLETHGFEYYTENGRTVLRQLPAENNALGRVKFIFPNEHSTFLHDSPQKRFFKYSIRAFSHGCMRVWEPLKLAEILLKNDGQWHDGITDEIEDFQTRHINFKKKFDVFIDYFTVRVDDNGLVHFLADPYHYVKDALNPPTEKQLQCKPAERKYIQRTSLQKGGGDDVGSDDSTGVD